ncbi:MAG TPA: hypothetical protein EYP03_04100, partial [Aquificae bacterium]|nr:hypothetical protein [Aquificota bacterium]
MQNIHFTYPPVDIREYMRGAQSFEDKVSRVVEVDYFVGGCPPHREQIERIVEAIVSGNLPPK